MARQQTVVIVSLSDIYIIHFLVENVKTERQFVNNFLQLFLRSKFRR
jgi:hypothetical protein